MYNNLNACFQNDLAILDNRGKMVLKDRTSVLKCPNGTGGVFKTIPKYDLSKPRIARIRPLIESQSIHRQKQSQIHPFRGFAESESFTVQPLLFGAFEAAHA